MNVVQLRWRSVLIPKRGNSLSECEDAIAGDPERGLFAVADGASESFTAGEWARYLVAGYIEQGPEESQLSAWLNEMRSRWKSEIDSRQWSWFAEQKSQEGAYATFLGLQLQPQEQGFTYRGLAAGDSCLIRLQGDRVVQSFPLESADLFGRRPDLINSRRGIPTWRFVQGSLQAGDRLLLVTDALALRILNDLQQQQGIDPCLLECDEFAMNVWVDIARDSGTLNNDDVALGLLDVTEGTR